MKKFLNDPKQFVPEFLEGIQLASGGALKYEPKYNLIYREEEREMLPYCRDAGIGIIPWSPLARSRVANSISCSWVSSGTRLAAEM